LLLTKGVLHLKEMVEMRRETGFRGHFHSKCASFLLSLCANHDASTTSVSKYKIVDWRGL
jgi:hypothetical protein